MTLITCVPEHLGEKGFILQSTGCSWSSSCRNCTSCWLLVRKVVSVKLSRSLTTAARASATTSAMRTEWTSKACAVM